jgi:hypothetical protein
VTPGDIVRMTETVTVWLGYRPDVVLIPEMLLVAEDIRGGDVRLNYGWGSVWIPSRLVEAIGCDSPLTDA